MKTCTIITVLLWWYQTNAIETKTTSVSNFNKRLTTTLSDTFSTKPSILANKTVNELSYPSAVKTTSDTANLQNDSELNSTVTGRSVFEENNVFNNTSNEIVTTHSSVTLPGTDKNEVKIVISSKMIATTLPLSEKVKVDKENIVQRSSMVTPTTFKIENKVEVKGTLKTLVVNVANNSQKNFSMVNKNKNNTNEPKASLQKVHQLKSIEKQPVNIPTKTKIVKTLKKPSIILKQNSLATVVPTLPTEDEIHKSGDSISTKEYQTTTSKPLQGYNKNKSIIMTKSATPPMAINLPDAAEKVTTTIASKKATASSSKSGNSSNKSIAQHSANEAARFSAPIINSLQERADALGCDISLPANDMKIWRGNQTQELALPMTTPENCPVDADCLPMIFSWEGYAEIQSGDVLLVRIDDNQLIASEPVLNNATKKQIERDDRPHHSASQTAVYQVTRPGHANCDVTEGILLDITPLVVDGKKLVTLYDKDLTEGVNLLIVVSELWGNQCIRLNVTVKSDNCGENQDCSQKGLCFSNTSMESFECQCCSGFIGPHCEERDACHLSPCTNNGICVDVSQGPDGSTYQCLCPYGFSGLNCEYEYNECDSSPCMNEAICSDLVNGYNCLCKQGYMGQRCEIKVDLCNPNPCSKNRICIDHGNNFSCECAKGLYGLECLQPTRSACSDNICANGGTCWSSVDSFYCACRPGYTGKVCEDEFIVEAVAGQDVVLGPHQNHFHNNIYVAAGTLCLAITIVGLVVAACHCRVNKTYRKLLQKAHPLLRQRSSDSEIHIENENQNQQHWLTEKPLNVSRPLDYDMFYALDFGESQSSPLIQ